MKRKNYENLIKLGSILIALAVMFIVILYFKVVLSVIF